MKLYSFSVRTIREILRDPLNLCFGLGFTAVLLLLMTAIQANIPVELFAIEHLAPGMAVFGLSFITLFAATLIAKDRESAFLSRLYTTPLTALDFILGYALPIVPIALGQGVFCYLISVALGLPVTADLLAAIACIVPISLFYIGMGLLCGSVLSVKQVGGICGALLTNLAGWLSGIWFDLELVGGAFKKVAYCLPFVHAVELERAMLGGNTGDILPDLLWVLGYGVATFAAAVVLFLRQMKK